MEKVVVLTMAHWVFVFWVLVCIIAMGLRKDPLIPCVLGLLTIGWMVTESFVGGVTTVFNGLLIAGREFLDIIVIISIIVALSRLLTDTKSDYLIMKPAAKLMVNGHVSFWILGFAMLIASWFFWPSPATALIGAIMVPIAVRSGLPIMGVAISMNLFGHGIGLSTDYIIQGAPAITAKAAGITAGAVMKASIPLALTMGIVTTVVAYLMIRKEIQAAKSQIGDVNLNESMQETAATKLEPELDRTSYFLAIITPLLFLMNVIAMFTFDLKGGAATALLGGTTMILLVLGCVLKYGKEGFEQLTEYTRSGFMFGIKIFAPVIVIGAFFFMGKADLAQAMMGPNAVGFLEDLGKALSQTLPMNTFFAALISLGTGMIVGLDGSGFSPLPLVGSVAGTLGSAINIDVPTLAALGQIAGVWTGGGTIIPWGVIPVAAITGVNPIDLARKNLIPVLIGLAVTTLVSLFFL